MILGIAIGDYQFNGLRRLPSYNQVNGGSGCIVSAYVPDIFSVGYGFIMDSTYNLVSCYICHCLFFHAQIICLDPL